jgi:hypothetical protein
LFARKKVLKWNKLTRRGFEEPSVCQMSMQMEENAKHLFNLWGTANVLWDKERNSSDNLTKIEMTSLKHWENGTPLHTRAKI